MIQTLTRFQKHEELEKAIVRGPDIERDKWEREHYDWIQEGEVFHKVPIIRGGMPNQTTNWWEPIYVNKSAGPTVASSAVEAALLNASTEQPILGGFNFFGYPTSQAKAINFVCRGQMQTVATAPNFTFFVRIGTTLNVITGTSLLQSGAITTVVTANGGLWEMNGTILCTTPGIGANAATITSSGTVGSGIGFTSPFYYAMYQGGSLTTTWTVTLDGSATQYLMWSMNPGTSSASNTCNIQTLTVWSTTN